MGSFNAGSNIRMSIASKLTCVGLLQESSHVYNEPVWVYVMQQSLQNAECNMQMNLCGRVYCRNLQKAESHMEMNLCGRVYYRKLQ